MNHRNTPLFLYPNNMQILCPIGYPMIPISLRISSGQTAVLGPTQKSLIGIQVFARKQCITERVTRRTMIFLWRQPVGERVLLKEFFKHALPRGVTPLPPAHSAEGRARVGMQVSSLSGACREHTAQRRCLRFFPGTPSSRRVRHYPTLRYRGLTGNLSSAESRPSRVRRYGKRFYETPGFLFSLRCTDRRDPRGYKNWISCSWDILNVRCSFFSFFFSLGFD